MPVFGCRLKADVITGAEKGFQRAIGSIERTIDLLHLRRFGLFAVDIYGDGTIGNIIRLLLIGIDHA